MSVLWPLPDSFLSTYDLVWHSSLAFSAASSYYQISTIIGIPIRSEDGILELVLGVGNVRI